MTAGTVLVTGANGFIALHIIGKLLDRGFNVIGTVRSQGKIDDMYKKFDISSSDPKLKLFVVKDIIKEGAFDSLLEKEKDIKYVLHTASPFKFGFTDNFDQDYRKPAVEGTLNILKAIHKYGENVKTVVVTSSFVSIINLDKVTDPTFVHTEETWNPLEWSDVTDETTAYFVSKKLAEKAAWDFVKNNNVKFALNTIAPPYVFGPQYFTKDAATDTLNTSNEIIGAILKADEAGFKSMPTYNMIAVDVRDVAEYHIQAIERDIKGKRLFAAGETFNNQKVLNIINENFPQLVGKVPKGTPEDAYTLQEITAVDSEESKKLLGGFKYNSLRNQVFDTVQQVLIAKGTI